MTKKEKESIILSFSIILLFLCGQIYLMILLIVFFIGFCFSLQPKHEVLNSQRINLQNNNMFEKLNKKGEVELFEFSIENEHEIKIYKVKENDYSQSIIYPLHIEYINDEKNSEYKDLDNFDFIEIVKSVEVKKIKSYYKIGFIIINPHFLIRFL